MPELLTLFLTPFTMAALLLMLPLPSEKILKRVAIAFSAIPLILLTQSSHWIGADVNYNWMPTLSIRFHLSVDTLSLIFLYLTSFIIPFSLIAHSKSHPFPRLFYTLVLTLQGLLIGFFTAADLVLFTIFWEAMLLPLYFIINLWGEKKYPLAAMKFLIYMIAGSFLMIAAVLFLYFNPVNQSATFDIKSLAAIAELSPHATLIAIIFLLAFAVKAPLFPFHGWLPDAYCAAPVSGTILLSAILSKAGIYGILRIGIPFFPTLIHQWGPVLLGFAITGVLYGALAAWVQNDFKRLLAYSSFSHVNFILVGLFIWSDLAHTGAIIQTINHAVTITGLFLVASYLEKEIKTTSIMDMSGVASSLPRLCWLTLFFVLAAVAVPGTNNFVGELLIFLALFNQNIPWLTPLLGLSIILSVVYMLRWMQKSFFGPAAPSNKHYVDIQTKQMLITLPLIIMILWVGIYPAPFLSMARDAISTTETK